MRNKKKTGIKAGDRVVFTGDVDKWIALNKRDSLLSSLDDSLKNYVNEQQAKRNINKQAVVDAFFEVELLTKEIEQREREVQKMLRRKRYYL